MDPNLLERIHRSILQKRSRMAGWLSNTPARIRALRLESAGEDGLQAHLRVLDEALEKSADQTLGLCTVCNEPVDPELLVMDYTSCVCLEHLSPEDAEMLEAELQLSQRVQRGLLPQTVPVIPGIELAAFSRPAQILGGDYFDFLQFRDGSHALAIADVAGHGVSASLIMASVQAALRALVPNCDSASQVADRMNRFVMHNIQFSTFVTLFLARIDMAGEELQYSSAGHNPALLIRAEAAAGDRISWLGPTGPAIGLVEGFAFAEDRIPIQPGDVLVLYTDGVTEAMNERRELFGQDRLADMVSQAARSSPQELVTNLRIALESFCAGRPLEDDTTYLVLKFLPFEE